MQRPILYLCCIFSLIACPLFGQLTVNFSVDTTRICAPGIVQFTDLSNSISGNITQWEWRQNGFLFSTLQNPSLFINNPGTTDICLKVSDNQGNVDSLCLNNLIRAFQGPTANFSSDVQQGCSPLAVQFTDLSTPGDAPLANWRWDFGDGFIDTLQINPAHNYQAIGNFDVTLVVRDTNGCRASFLSSNLITTFPTPAANIVHTGTQQQCGLPAAVTFQGSSNLSNASYTWDMGDGNTRTGSSLTYNYLQVGCFSPTLTVSNGSCSVTTTVSSCISVVAAPSASFSIVDSTACAVPFTTQFNNQSTGFNALSWTFGNGSNSNTPNPSTTYNSYYSTDTTTNPAGVFPVILEASNAAGCVDSDTQYVYISDLRAEVRPRGLICAPDTVGFTASSFNISSTFFSVQWDWQLDSGFFVNGPFANAYYPDSGRYNVQVIVTDNIGCKDTTSRTLSIGIPPVVDTILTDTNFICRITGINFTGIGSDYNDWNWEFSDNSSGTGPNFLNLFSDTGWITGFVVVNFRGCFDSIPLDSYYIYPPIAKYSPIVVCDSLKVFFIDESIGAHRWYWDFGDTTTTSDTSNLSNPNYTYPSTGTYTVMQIVYNDSTGCVDTFRNVVILGSILADFTTIDSICTGDSIQPINLSVDAVGYQWVAPFALPSNSSNNAPTITYNRAGIFPLTLYVFDNNGCPDSTQQLIYVAGIDTNIQHSPDPVCRATPITFQDSSTGILSPIVSWLWGNNSTQSSTVQQYIFSGNQIMPLQVQNSWGCTFNLEDSIAVGGLFVNFTSAQQVCLGNSVTLIALLNSPANAGGQRPYTYIWDFGDGRIDTTTVDVINHFYDSAGIYDVCLQIIDGVGCISTRCKPAWIEVADPTPLFTADTFFSSCPPLEVNFSNLSLSGNQWTWRFGDGSSSNLENPTHVYSTPGFYDVSLEITAFSGCSAIDTIVQMIQITGPAGSFSSPAITSCSPRTVEFVGFGNNVASYTWLFGNGASQTNINNTASDTINYTYTQAGQYVPILVLDDGMGCQIPIEQDTITIFEAPTPAFSVDSLICLGDSLHFQLQTNISPGLSIAWTFEQGNPSSSNLVNPSVAYSDTGSFEVKLLVTQNGCADSLVLPNAVQIAPLPTANFNMIQADTCLPSSIRFVDSSSSPNSVIQQWQWQFPSFQANLQDTTLLYDTTGVFAVQLWVENNFGCRDTIQQNFVTYPTATANIQAPIPTCAEDTITIRSLDMGTWQWQSSTWISQTNTSTIQSVVDSSAWYYLLVENAFGCTATDSVFLTAQSLTVIDAGDSVQICQGDSIQLQASGNTTLFDWGLSNNLSCRFCSNPIASPSSSQWYYLQSDSSNPCANYDSVWVEVLPLPTLTITADSSICTGDSLQLLVTGAQTYQWQGVGISNPLLANPWVMPDSTTIYTVIAQDSNGCSATASHPIQLRSTAASPLNSATICRGDSNQLPNIAGSMVNWQGNALSCTTCNAPTASPLDSSQYIVNYLNVENCPIVDSTWIYVLDLRQLAIIGPDSLCEGDSVALLVTGYQQAALTWSPTLGLSNANSPQPLAFPTSTISYTVRLNEGNCADSASINLAVAQLPNIQASDLSYCLGDTAQLIASSSTGQVIWRPGIYLSDSLNLTPFVFAPNSQSYQVQSTNACGTASAMVLVTVSPPPSVVIDSSITAFLGNTIQLEATTDPSNSLSWSPDSALSCSTCPNPDWLVTGDETFFVLATDPLGCSSLDSIQIKVLPNCTSDLVFVPSAFSPNGDGQNDLLFAQSSSIQELDQFQIYNRWGELVFETRDLLQGWDGRYKGQALAPDVYGYFLRFRCPNTGLFILKKGNITILR